MIKAAIYGFGNIGHFVYEALIESIDFEIVGIVSKSFNGSEYQGTPVVKSIDELKDIKVAVLCSGSMDVPDIAAALLAKGIYTVDSFDIHGDIVNVRNQLMPIAKKSGVSAIIAAGWDPGSDSVIRTLFEAMTPKGLTYTNFGPGMSMGHTVAAKTVKGVKNALSMTIPLGTSIHRRNVYIELEDGSNIDEVTAGIKNHPYFSHDETHVIPVDCIDDVKDMGHGVDLTRKGVSGSTQNQNLRFTMSINNPALTAQILVSCARAVILQAPGCYTLIEIPPIHLLYGDTETLIKRLV